MEAVSRRMVSRRDAARAVGQFIGTPEGRQLLQHNGYANDVAVLAVLEDEAFDTVVIEHMSRGTATLVAVFFPERVGTSRLEFLFLDAQSHSDRAFRTVREPMRLGRGADGHTSSIGTVVDALSGRSRRLTIGDIPLTAPERGVLKDLSARTFQPA